MDYDALVTFVQKQFTDGLALVIGSGLSAAEGIPGMLQLAEHLKSSAGKLTGTDSTLWNKIKAVLDAGEGLESALLQYPPSETLEVWIAKETCALLIPEERKVMQAVLCGKRILRLTA